MAVSSNEIEARRSGRPSWWRTGIAAGLAGGLAMAAVVMLFGLLFEESGAVFDAPMAIWAWVFGAEHYGHAANHVWPIVLGLGAHFFNAIVVGLAIAGLALAAGVRRSVPAVAVAVLSAIVVWIAMRYLVLPANNDEAALLTTDTVVPQWVWWLSHLAYGLAAGLAFAAIAARSRDEEPERVVVAEARPVRRERDAASPRHGARTQT